MWKPFLCGGGDYPLPTKKMPGINSAYANILFARATLLARCSLCCGRVFVRTSVTLRYSVETAETGKETLVF